MIQSMTGFGSAEQNFTTQCASIEIRCEIKTLNSKFIDLQLRSPKSFSSFEADISKLVKKKLRRGRIEVYLSRQVLEGSTQEIRANVDEAQRLHQALLEIQQKLKLSEAPNLSHLLQMPDWLQTSEIPTDLEEEKACCLKAVDEALVKVRELRAAEGASLKETLLGHGRDLGQIFSEIENQSGFILEDLRARLSTRIQEVLKETKLDPQRLEQEIAIWVARSDFQEEIDRFRHHLSSFFEAIEKGGELGRRLEFLVQEMHRELNTMGSKCSAAQWTNKIIDMKALVERIREQIQNIE